ncbi:transcription factor Opi1-domain-containing protein [Roridomyces roridus]|uniref:Transcription factor Opi1-domain-containing protein n=1 Tax=Roridomyces roridus TaxID=1738132 RepID=A0AAD7AZC8_9AGAR|nr:transcription factor Opi1-domain-containing protein [Roridomyces roridus]
MAMDLELEDEDVRIAVRALGDMRNGKQQSGSSTTPFVFPPSKAAAAATSPSASSSPSQVPTPALSLSLASTSTHPASSPPRTPPLNDTDGSSGDGKAQEGTAPVYPSLARMQSLPLVSGALRVYEAGKANSRVVQYTSSLVSSSLRHASSHLPAGSGERMDELAGGMLDRLGAPKSYTEDRDRERTKRDRDVKDTEPEAGRVPSWLHATSPFVPPPPPPPPTATDKGKGKRREEDAGSPTNGVTVEDRQVAPRSGWQAMLLEAGGLSAALSDESMRKLRYCLQWLQYATQHIDAQILILRDFIASLQPAPPPTSSSSSDPSSSSSTPELTPDHLRTLSHLRSDIVHTIRQVVGVVSKYAGGALPEPARGRVRGFILGLPRRFSGAEAGVGGSATGVSGRGTIDGTGVVKRRGAAGRRERGAGADETPPVSPGPRGHLHLRSSHGHGHSRHGSSSSTAAGEANGVGIVGEADANRAMAAAQRVLALAMESLDMMRGVTAVVGESLDRADAWVDRLRTVGIQRGMEPLGLDDGPGLRGARGSGGTPWSPDGSNAPSPRFSDAAPSPAYSAYSGAASPGIALGGMSLGTPREEEGEEDEEDGEREGEEKGMEVDG